jgi:hypothetical protein
VALGRVVREREMAGPCTGLVWAARVGPASSYRSKGVRRSKLGFEFE